MTKIREFEDDIEFGGTDTLDKDIAGLDVMVNPVLDTSVNRLNQETKDLTLAGNDAFHGGLESYESA
jgi:hypothetical protein